MENSETAGWLDFSFACKYINADQRKELILQNEEIGKLLYHMINNADKY